MRSWDPSITKAFFTPFVLIALSYSAKPLASPLNLDFSPWISCLKTCLRLHLSLSSFSLRQVISRRRSSAALLQEALASHGTQRFPPKFMAFNKQPDLICSLLLQRGETAFKTLPFLQPRDKKMMVRSHEHTGRIRCTWGTACVAHVSRCLRVVFPETSWTFQRLLGHFFKGGVGISYPHASGLLLAQLHSHFQTSKCRHLSARQLTKHCEKVERRWKKCLFTLFSIANAVTSIEI